MARTLQSNDGMITAQELAARSREPYDTINHWARMGVLPYKRRGRVRLFSAADGLLRCQRIRELQQGDCNLAAIRRMLLADSPSN